MDDCSKGYDETNSSSVISDMTVTKMISVFPEGIRRIFNVKHGALKRSEDVEERLSADNPETYIAWVHAIQVQVQAPNSDSHNILKDSLEMIRTL